MHYSGRLVTTQGLAEWTGVTTEITNQVTWVTPSAINTSYSFFAMVMEKIVYLQIYFAAAVTAGTNIGSIATGYAPNKQYWFLCGPANGGSTNARVTIASDRKINVYGAVSSGMFCSGIYFID